MKKSEINKLDTLHSKKVREKAGWRCEFCGSVDINCGGRVVLHCCHIVGRRHRSTRWGAWIDGVYDLCAWSGCYPHHNQYDEHGWQEPDIIHEVIGEFRLERIQQVADQTIAKYQDFEQIKQWIEEA